MAYFINVFLEVDSTSNEETIKILKEKGNYFEDMAKAVKAQKTIQKLMAIWTSKK